MTSLRYLSLPLAALLLTAGAAAQTATPVVFLEDSTIDKDSGDERIAKATFELLFMCPNNAHVQADDWLLEGNLTGPDGFHIELDGPFRIENVACVLYTEHRYTFQATLHASFSVPLGVQHTFDAVFQANPDGDSPLSHSSNKMVASFHLAFEGEPEPVEADPEPVASVEQEAPGPAVPLLVAALAASALRRQRP